MSAAGAAPPFPEEPWLVVGLGNPGPGHAGNRHNVGAMVLDVLAARMGGRFTSAKGRADVVAGRMHTISAAGSPRVVLVRPRAYMNDSGPAVAHLRSFYKVPPEAVVAVHDELDLPYGSLRLKLGGGDNGHNGLRSLRSSLGSGEFHRVRIGIGRPPGQMDPAAFVLRDFSAAERKELPLLLDAAADAVQDLLTEGLAPAQARHNS